MFSQYGYLQLKAFPDAFAEVQGVLGLIAEGGIDDHIELDAPYSVTTFESGGTTYAAVAAYTDDGVQILDLSDPSDPVPVGKIGDTTSLMLDGPRSITTFESGGTTYAAVAAYNDDGVQILDLSDPSDPVPAGSITDTGNFELDGPYSLAIFESGGTTYAAIPAIFDDGVQILDLSDPSDPVPASSITDTDNLALDGPYSVTTFESGGTTYAAVTALDDDGVQILDLSDPSDPVPAGSITDTADLELDAPYSLAIFESGGTTYAAIPAIFDDGVQILDLSDPSDPVPAGSIDDDNIFELESAYSITTFVSGGTTYAAIAAVVDDGVQILDLSDPSNPAAAGSITDTDNLVLAAATSITTFESGGTTYAAVAAYNDDGVQILDLSDPSNPAAAGSITDTADLALGGATSVTTFVSGGTTYAAVASESDDGVQILDLSDPSDPVPAGNITDTANLVLDEATSVTTFVSGGTTYAAVTAFFDNGVQILDLSDPSDPVPAGNITDTADLALRSPVFITTFESGGTTYAAVAAYDDNGVQILDLSDPSDPVATGNITDTADLALATPSSVTAFASGDTTYAAVASITGDGVQILDLSDPSNPVPVVSIIDTAGLELNGAASVTTFVSGGTTYAAVAAAVDAGVQIIRLNHSPTVDAGADQTVREGETATLSGTASDPEGDPLEYSWSSDDYNGAISGNGTLMPSFDAPEVRASTTYEFRLSVSDGTDATADAVSVRIIDLRDRPVLTVVGHRTITVLQDSSFEDPGATCRTYLDGAALPVTARGTVDTTATGTYKITYSCTHESTTITDARKVKVAGANEPPLIHIIRHQHSVPAGGGAPDYSSDAICRDREDGDISHKVTSSVSYSGDRATITYSCTDSSGRTVTASQTVAATDTAPPDVVLRGQHTVRIDVGSTYVDAGAYCVDDVDGTSEARKAADTVDTSKEGSYRVAYMCSDSAGNYSVEGRIVLVQPVDEDVRPVLTVSQASVTVRVGDAFSAPPATCTDREDGDISDRITLLHEHRVDTDRPGSYVVYYTCEDTAGQKVHGHVRVIVVE